MATESTLDLVNYYAKLLIIQYVNLPKASNTIKTTVTPILMPQVSTQFISFSQTPTSGTFVLNYNGNNSSTINWNDNSETIQGYLQLLPGLSQVVVTGTISSDVGLTVIFEGMTVVAQLLTVFSNNLSPTSNISITETDLTLPLAVQNAFDIETAIGAQLDILGKYTGVTRSINTPTKTVFLEDNDFRTLIKFAIIKHNSGSSMGIIEDNLNKFFPGDFIVTDYKTMYMSFIFGSSIGSFDLFLSIIQEGLLPVPMAVGYSAIIPPILDQFFGYCTYESDLMPHGNKPYNLYEDVHFDWLYLQYSDFI